jgi:hypothetical protein
MPADPADIEVGKAYVYDFSLHCRLQFFPTSIGGRYWDPLPTFDWRDVREWLANVDQDDFADGHVRGVLHWRTADRLEFSVPGTDLEVTYEPTTGPVLCI